MEEVACFSDYELDVLWKAIEEKSVATEINIFDLI